MPAVPLEKHIFRGFYAIIPKDLVPDDIKRAVCLWRCSQYLLFFLVWIIHSLRHYPPSLNMYTHLNTHTSLIQMMVLADSVTGFKVPVGFGPAADGRCDCRRDTEGRLPLLISPWGNITGCRSCCTSMDAQRPDYHSYAHQKHQSNR